MYNSSNCSGHVMMLARHKTQVSSFDLVLRHEILPPPPNLPLHLPAQKEFL